MTDEGTLDENELSGLLEQKEFYVMIGREFGTTVGREFGAVVGDHLEDDLRRRLETSEQVQRIVAEDEPTDDREQDVPEGRIGRFKAWVVAELRTATRRVIATAPELIETLTDEGQGPDPSGREEHSSDEEESYEQTSGREQSDNDGGDAVSSDLDVDTAPESEDDLESLSYRELQTMAKEAGIKANISRERMTERLADELGLDVST